MRNFFPYFFKLLSCFNSNIIWRIDTNQKNCNNLYLTFDDGPNPNSTAYIIDLLDQLNIKATFFCLGKNAEQYPEWIEIIRTKGHKIGAHGYFHLDGCITNSPKYIENVIKSLQLLNTNLFRPPYGRPNPFSFFYLTKKYKIVFWTHLVYDFKSSINCENELKMLKNNTKNGAIIVFHDNIKAKDTIKNILPLYLEWAIENKFSFETLI